MYYCVDNGSNDHTGEIIRRNAERDSRIVALTNKENHVWEPGNSWQEIIANFNDDAFFCILDADDEYKPDFLKNMLAFASDNHLDVAACGYDFIDAKTGKLRGVRNQDQNIILEKTGFSDYFIDYHQYMRTHWANIFTLALLKKCSFDNIGQVSYGADTIFTMEAFQNASRAGILAESLHKYYRSVKSISYQWDSRRIVSDRILDDLARAYLIGKGGKISRKNDDFLLEVYFSAIVDTLKVLLSTDIPVAEKYTWLHDIFFSDNTQKLIAWQGFRENKEKLFDAVSDWILGQKNVFSDENGKTVVEILYMIDKFELLCEYRPILRGILPKSSVFLGETIAAVLRDDLPAALDEILCLADSEIPDDFAESYLLLALNICAMAEYADGWLFFKKLYAQYLLDYGREANAKSVIDELVEMLPNDNDCIELTRRLCSLNDFMARHDTDY
jgi:glycosyltransferase involved in cell wall biosynthesis